MRACTGWPAVAAMALCGTAAAGAEPLRLAATLHLSQEERAALLERDGRQAWLRPGDHFGDCRLERIGQQAAALQCGSGPLLLRLTPGPGTDREALPVVQQVILPAGALQTLASRPQAVARGIDLRAEVDGPAVIGWRITRLDASSPVGALGLRAADLVVNVDGFPAREPERFAAALRALPGRGAFTIDLLRDGQPLRLHLIAPPE